MMYCVASLFQLFVGYPEMTRPAYSPQVLPLMKILGLIIGHLLVHEGPGFPFLAPFVFWYLASGSEQIALPYVSVNDLSTPVMVIQAKLVPLCACLHLNTILLKVVMSVEVFVILLLYQMCTCSYTH